MIRVKYRGTNRIIRRNINRDRVRNQKKKQTGGNIYKDTGQIQTQDRNTEGKKMPRRRQAIKLKRPIKTLAQTQT